MSSKKYIVSLFSALVVAGLVLSAFSGAEPAIAVDDGGKLDPRTFAAITIDGTNDFVPAAHVTEDPFAAPTAGGSATNSDALNETSAYYWIDGGWTDHTLTGGNGADIKQFYLQWDASYLYLGVRGPSGMMDNDDVDLFIAIDRDGIPGSNLGQPSTAWGKWVDFDQWTPSHFIAVSQARDVSGDGWPQGYAEFITVGGPSAALTWGADWSNSGWVADTSDPNSGVFFEFRLAWSSIGGQPNSTTGAPMNFAVYTTYNADHYEIYDSAPGVGQGAASPYEEVGDYKGDGDHCYGELDPVTRTSDGTCGWGDSDNNNGAGVPQAGRHPGSDDGADETPDTIGEYFRILNVGQISPNAVRLVSFTATPLANAIRLDWETATEIDNLGFNLYRAAGPNAERACLNAGLIPSLAPGSPAGARYTWLDQTVRRGATYYYWLEDVDIYGRTTLHGPATATVRTPRPRLSLSR